MAIITFFEKSPDELVAQINVSGLDSVRNETLSAMVDGMADAFMLAFALGCVSANPLSVEAAYLRAIDRLDEPALTVETDGCQAVLALIGDGIIFHSVNAIYEFAHGDDSAAVRSYTVAIEAACGVSTIYEMNSYLDDGNGGNVSPLRDIASSGGKARQSKNNQLKEITLEKYRSGTYKSMRDAASKLTEFALQEAKRIGAQCSQDNAHRRVYDWIREHSKTVTKAG